MSKTPDNLYVNLLYNPNDTNVNFISRATINKTMTQPVLLNPSEYYASIIRFRIPVNSLPMYHFPIDRAQSNPNVSNLSIGVSNGGIKANAKLIFVPDTMGLDPPPISNLLNGYYFTNEQVASAYYGCYSVDVLIRAFNVAINTAMTGLAEPRPYFIYNPVTELISCIVDNAFIAAGLRLFINYASITYLDAFPYIINYNSGIHLDDFYFKFDIPPYLGVSPFEFKSEYSNMGLWMDLTKIIITSIGLPIRGEQSPVGESGVSNSIPIFTDFEVALDKVAMTNSVAVYNPISQYRLVDLISNAPLSKIDLGFLYEDRFGNIRPILVDASQSISVKIGFFKKSIYNSDGTRI
jgi:hypothetical protein